MAGGGVGGEGEGGRCMFVCVCVCVGKDGGSHRGSSPSAPVTNQSSRGARVCVLQWLFGYGWEEHGSLRLHADARRALPLRCRFFTWTGPNLFDSSLAGTQGVLTYAVEVQTAGQYEILIRNFHNDPDSTESNDAWLQVNAPVAPRPCSLWV